MTAIPYALVLVIIGFLLWYCIETSKEDSDK